MRMTEEQYQEYRANRYGIRPKPLTMQQYRAWKDSAPLPQALQPKPSKYRNKRVRDAEGNVHDSGKEYRRWTELQLLERAGSITGLRRQVPFALLVNGILVCQYVADFAYHDGAAQIVEDCKSPPTRKLAAYRIKAKLMLACHAITIREI